MNIYVIFTLLLALPAVSAQTYSQNNWCRSICRLVQNCAPSSQYCARLVTLCGCNGPARTPAPTRAPTTRRTTTTMTTRRPVTQNGCGVGGMANAQQWLDSLPRIVGGFDAPSGYFPWQVKVRPGQAHCGGALINSDTVVTAAHCVNVFENIPGSVEIAFGSIDTNNAQRIIASRVIVHPGYSRESQPDIAIIKLERSIRFSRFVQPVCLPQQNQDITTDSLAIVTGWGITSESGSRIPNTMRYVPVPIVSQSQCNDYFRGGIRNGEFCAGYAAGGRDACQGDSGGALVMPNRLGRWELVGVVSRGIGCARPTYPGIYSRVANYVSWIRQYM